MVHVRICDLIDKKDLNLVSKPYTIKGKFIIQYVKGEWKYKVEKYKQETVDEDIPIDYTKNYNKYKNTYHILGAYIDDKCVGFALVEKESRTRYLYVKEVRTDANYVNQGIGTKLLQHCFDFAISSGYRGLYTVTIDNHIDSCNFYINNGFRVGGIDTEYHMGSKNEGKKDIIFYRG